MDFFKKRNSKDSMPEPKKQQPEYLKADIIYNVYRLKLAFQYPRNSALIIRELQLPSLDHKKATVLYIEGTVDTNMIDEHIITPLLHESKPPIPNDNFTSEVVNSILTTSNAKTINSFEDAIKDMINGNTIILIDKEEQAVSVDTAGFENRSLSDPTTEPVIKGPKVAFNESAAVNRSLIRKYIKDPQLICELITVGERTPQQVSVMYLEGIADKDLIEAMKKRLSDIERDGILELTLLEQCIEERPYSLIPSTMTTERPDRACFFLQEGHVVLLLEGSPLALIAPITFWSLFQTAEDQYFRWAYGNLTRHIRLISLLLALFIPALYIAISSYHPEMLPTDLMLAIAGTRERVPVPVIVELLFMQITFEILREAGTRIPTQIGPTIGIVGALILGQAAVQANLVSPILVVIVAITGLASFAIPDVSLNVAVRLISFIFILAANFMGFFGLALCTTFIIAYLLSVKSFGVPFFAPYSPHLPSSKDLYSRPVFWRQWLRPFSTSPEDKARAEQPKGDRRK
ncbi:spore germination protein [Bacillus niameyensis]|uniref:spore germination protein n=1 Tax=Bacillus niameyensis TaxID=1522308 RepID=UPI000782A231|nr:spore germination protein [Bacillus niameyensis]